jgi:hypothetical protein
MRASAAVFAGGAIPGPFAGFMMFVFAVRITGKSSTHGRNGHQDGNGKHSFHKG